MWGCTNWLSLFVSCSALKLPSVTEGVSPRLSILVSESSGRPCNAFPPAGQNHLRKHNGAHNLMEITLKTRGLHDVLIALFYFFQSGCTAFANKWAAKVCDSGVNGRGPSHAAAAIVCKQNLHFPSRVSKLGPAFLWVTTSFHSRRKLTCANKSCKWVSKIQESKT